MHGNLHESELYSFTGPAMSDEVYRKLGYDTHMAILFRFNRKRSRTFLDQTVRTAPLPKGVSGGGVFAWPKDIEQHPQPRHLKLVGIFHTYYGSDHCAVATRLNTYIAYIYHNNPDLKEPEMQLADGSFPTLICIAWYKKEEWPQVLSQSQDAGTMFRTWQEWRQAAMQWVEDYHRRGHVVASVTITPNEIGEFCRQRGLPITGKARTELASLKFGHSLFGREVEVGPRGENRMK